MKITAKEIFIHSGLFLVTFITTMIAGVAWGNQNFTELTNIGNGLVYSILIMIFITAHEFGHYFASVKHGVNATLPYYIPAPPIPGLMPNFGTFGAVIKTRSPILSRKQLFDIGASGPLAGFVVCIIFLIIGFATLPSKEFIYELHPEYLLEYGGEIPRIGLHFGDTILYSFFKWTFGTSAPWIPPMNELYHFPFLNVGWFGLFVTSLNMLPLGQLDGGHVTYAMFGAKQRIIARWVWWFLFTVGLVALIVGLAEFLRYDFPNKIYIHIQNIALPAFDWIKNNLGIVTEFWLGWLFWAFVTRFFIKLPHPEIADNTEIGTPRMIIGWIALLVLLLSFSINGIYFIE